jgi:hypothetical protein
MEIEHGQFENYRDLILSGQIEQQDVSKLMDENPTFAMWYRLKSKASVQQHAYPNLMDQDSAAQPLRAPR